MGISINGPSGIDTSYIIDSLVAIEKQKITKVENQKKAYQLKIDAYSKLKSYLLDIKTKAAALSKISSFDMFTTSSSNDKAVTIKGGTGSVDGQYGLRVFQIAASEKMISGDGKLSGQDVALSTLGIGVGDISIDGTTISIDADDTLQDLRLKINTATDASGNKLGVSASVLKVSDTNFRLVLSGKETGSTGIAYKDLTGTTLQDLGIITTADGDKGSAAQVLTSGSDVQSAFNALGIGESISYSGTDRTGNAVTGTFIKSATSTVDDLLTNVKQTYHDMVDAAVDVAGNLVITDKVSGRSQLSMTALNLGAAPVAMSATSVGQDGAGVLSAGRDAYFSVENISMTSATNSISGIVAGATFELLKANATEVVTVGLSRDMSGIQKKFQDLVDSYNALLRFKKESQKVVDAKDEKSKKGDLAGDSTIGTIIGQIRQAFQQQFNLTGGTYTNFPMVGLKTDTQNGEFTVDEEIFKKALETNFDDVIKLFTTTGVSSSQAVQYGKHTSDTKSGVYTVEEVDATTFRYQLQGTTDWYSSNERVGDIISFGTGPAQGLSLTAAPGSIAAGSSISFTFQKGLASIIEDTITTMTDGHTGVVTLRQESWRKSIGYSEDRILTLEDRMEKYRLRLVRQFSDMEQAMSSMQAQSNKMISSLSSFSSN